VGDRAQGNTRLLARQLVSLSAAAQWGTAWRRNGPNGRERCGNQSTLKRKVRPDRAEVATASGLPMSDVTQILSAIEDGEPSAAEQLLPLVYDELRKLAAARLAAEKPGQTLQPTALVHEAYLRLVDGNRAQNWNSRGHFFAAAAEAMRRILVENARRKGRLRRGGDRRRQPLNDNDAAAETPTDAVDLLALNEALEKLASAYPRRAELVKLRYFAGLTLVDAARLLGVSRSTAEADWTYAKAWLKREIGES